MSDFGQRLHAARERRGVSLRDISERTKFTVAAIEGLERNDISRLPGGIFARAFVRSYAAEVGLDPEATVREFIERFDVEPVPSTAVANEASAPAPAVMPMVLKLVAISLVAVAIILYFTRIRHADDSTMAPTDARRTSRRVVSAVSNGAQLP